MPLSASTQLLPVYRLGASVATDGSEQVSTLAKLISEYGTEVVIIAVFILIFSLFVCMFLKMLNKFMTSTLEQNKKIVEALIGNKLDEDKEKPSEKKEEEKHEIAEETTEEHSHNIVIKDQAIREIFDNISRSVIGELRCDRVAVYVFHNGNKTPYGYSFVKMSCIHEQTMRGATTTRGVLYHKDMPLHVFSNIIDCLIRNGEYIIGNVYNHGIISADEQILNFIANSRTKSLYAMAIKDNHDEVAAFVIAEYNDEQDFSTAKSYTTARNALKNMCDTIHSVVIPTNFKK